MRRANQLSAKLVKKIVEEHGGWIHLESPPEGGARIVIRLPLHGQDPASLPAPTVLSTPDKEAG